MAGGQITLNAVTDAQLEALLDVKKSHEGLFQLVSLQVIGQPIPPGFPPPPPGFPPGFHPGMPGYPVPPGMPVPPPPPMPIPPQSTYNVTLAWESDEGMKAIASVFDRISTAS